MTKREQRLSRFLSLVLRHKPEEIGLEIDLKGWARVDDLLSSLEQNGKKLTLEGLKNIVAENNKKRFAFSDDGRSIRASQGHSIEINLELTPQSPPEFLYHGTATRFIGLIEKKGLIKMSRQHVHLNEDIRIAHEVGKRHGRPIILEITASVMEDHGHQFFVSDNGVWLTEFVPPDYLSRRFKL